MSLHSRTASNGANLQWPIQLGLPDAIGCDQTSGDAWKFAVVNAATYLAASLVGCWLSDPLSESFAGRRAPICISAILILASMIGCALTKHWAELLGCRILLGIGMGCKATVRSLSRMSTGRDFFIADDILRWSRSSPPK